LHSKDDSISYVFLKRGIKKVKQEILVGGTNNNEAVVELGLEEDDKVYLSVPEGMDDEPIALLPELDGKRSLEEEPLVVEPPRERTITLPDGRTITVPEGASPPPGGMGRMQRDSVQTQSNPQNSQRGDSLRQFNRENMRQRTDGQSQGERPSANQPSERSGQNN
jgi:hypothetical protein